MHLDITLRKAHAETWLRQFCGSDFEERDGHHGVTFHNYDIASRLGIVDICLAEFVAIDFESGGRVLLTYTCVGKLEHRT
jgi:hypothetical protein